MPLTDTDPIRRPTGRIIPVRFDKEWRLLFLYFNTQKMGAYPKERISHYIYIFCQSLYDTVCKT